MLLKIAKTIFLVQFEYVYSIMIFQSCLQYCLTLIILLFSLNIIHYNHTYKTSIWDADLEALLIIKNRFTTDASQFRTEKKAYF